jgi:thiol-disulfide isomerase/thioredoxin
MSLQLDAQDVKVISFKEFEIMKERNDDKTYVYNFMATWCVPCVKEIPYFEELNEKYRKNNVNVVFISLDFKIDLESRLIPLIKKHKILSEVYLLHEPDYNSWINKVDTSWSGAIPATLIVNSRKKISKFYEKTFYFQELEEIIKPFIN